MPRRKKTEGQGDLFPRPAHDIEKAIQAREEGMDTVVEHQEAVEPSWMDRGRAEVAALAANLAAFTVDDLPDSLRKSARHPNLIGALLAACQREKLIRRISFARSHRRNAHARIVPVYTSTRT